MTFVGTLPLGATQGRKQALVGTLDFQIAFTGKQGPLDPSILLHGLPLGFKRPKEIIGLFADFHKKGIFEKSLNATFISLLPKVAGAEDTNKFRPISLVGSV